MLEKYNSDHHDLYSDLLDGILGYTNTYFEHYCDIIDETRNKQIISPKNNKINNFEKKI